MGSNLNKAIIFIFLLVGGHGCTTMEQHPMIDAKANPAAQRLYNGLFRAMNDGIMFGHQDDLAYGVNWKYIPGESDTKRVTGEYPAVYGWELGHLEVDSLHNLDSVPFEKMRDFIREGYMRGGVNTISWHLNNPLNGKTAWDAESGTVASILPGGEKHALFNTWLDKLAGFLGSIKDEKGNMIPVLFRPFHELNGSWFWWGRDHCTPDEFKALWRHTVTYLRDVKELHHLIYTFNTDRFSSREEYLERYPGDDWVDVIGFDIYQRELPREKYLEKMDSMFSTITTLAKERNKLPALTEFGGNIQADSAWWTETFLKTLENHKISYVLAWRNAGKKPDGSFEYYIPYPGEHSAPDFVRFKNSPFIMFQKKTSLLKLYE